MKQIPANRLLAGLCEEGSVSSEAITAVVTDSRKVEPGCVFVCFTGERTDGHNYAAGAARQGAAYIIANHPVEGVPQEKLILCKSSHAAMIRMGANYRDMFSPKMLGVTGSVGKTTTKEFCYAVLCEFGESIKTEGNQNNEIGVPNTLFRLQDSTEYAVVEMGMSALGEIMRLSRAARPGAGIITCIGVSHMESLGSRDNILKAKLEICTGLPDGAPLALNGDDAYLRKAEKENMIPARLLPVWYGIDDSGCEVLAKDIKAEENSQSFTICDRKYGSFSVTIPVPGRHNVYDALAAYAAATRMGLDAARSAKALENYKSTGMRQNIVHKNQLTVVEDCYNASPDSMKASLEMFRELDAKGGRKFALLGDMLELGELEKTAHEQVGGWAARAGLTTLVALGSASRYMVQAAQEQGLQAVWCENQQSAFEWLSQNLKPGDFLLAKASRGMKLENILKALYGEQPLQ